MPEHGVPEGTVSRAELAELAAMFELKERRLANQPRKNSCAAESAKRKPAGVS